MSEWLNQAATRWDVAMISAAVVWATVLCVGLAIESKANDKIKLLEKELAELKQTLASRS